ncbi:Protein MSN5 [Golovinomyces cichoracearum]|uniref:Protein MSN5 n=1 Tax=Golovinomyces cichoracearum TaxID=62708 RepID=A0A420ISD1_9PEZI|nr:Protein MSN5 [Golovinomyces cichoracearum]
MSIDCGLEMIGNNQLGPSQSSHTNENTISVLAQIQEALRVVHGSFSTKEARSEASAFLDHIKTDDRAPGHGYNLASDNTQQPLVRHYALSLLEYAIKYKWPEYSEIQETTLREWVIHLARCILPTDPAYLRNKIAQLWVEVAKKSWGLTWKDMDELLFRLWDMPDIVNKEFVLFTLEMLSDEIFNKEESTIIMRGDFLQKGCIEIFAPVTAYSEAFPNRERDFPIRYGEDGWLVRVGKFLDYILENNLYQAPQTMRCVVRALSIYKSVMSWTFSAAIASSSCVHYMTKTLAVSNVSIQLASVEAFNSLYNRANFTDDEFISLACPMFNHKVVDLLHRLFEWSCVHPHDIDEEKYLFSKKFSEMISNLGTLIEKKFSILPETCDLTNLFNLFFAIARSPSFLVSIPVLHIWTRLLQSDNISGSRTIESLVAPLLELASSRLIRYDVLSEDSDDPSMIFLLEDIDTVPERHAFLGNYRRYSAQIIETIVRKKVSEAIYHILNQVEGSIQHLYDGRAGFSVENYSKFSLPVLKIDAQFAIVEAALKGYIKWRSAATLKTQEDELNRINLENYMEAWCERLLSLKSEDPIIRKRVLQIAVAFSTSALDQKSGFMLKVLEHILTNKISEFPEHFKYTEAVKEMQMDSLHELQRLAIRMPDQLLCVYEQLERTVNQIVASGAINVKSQVAFQTFLFTIISSHRNTKLDAETCYEKLTSFIEPIQNLWQNPLLDQALLSFNGFCNVLGLDKVKEFLISRRVHEINEWSSYQLDAEGRAIQKELEDRLKDIPLRTTKLFLQCSTDRLDLSSPKLNLSRRLWKNIIPTILPHLLNFLRYAHAFHNPENWTGLPHEMSPIITRILSDRFWQSGISEGSKEEFYVRISGTKSTMEGLASSVRGSVRMIREAAYCILYCLSKFDVDFYGYSELPGPLASSLFMDAHFLFSHQLINLLQVVRTLVDDCPVELRTHFVPPLLATCYAQIDAKCTTQWEILTQRQSAATLDENLTDEMKEESLLRQITHAAVMLIANFLDPIKNNYPNSKDGSTESISNGSNHTSMRDFCLSSSIIMEPVLMFLSHAIGMRDTRSCGIVLRVFRSIIPDFSKSKAKLNGDEGTDFRTSIREFISRDVLMACISSLNEPYFVDLQRDLAHCIVSILVWYSEESPTPRQILHSIPKIQEGAVDKCLEYIIHPSMQIRHQRALVLELLSEIKGVSISEQGRIDKLVPKAQKERSKMQQEFMKDQSGNSKVTGSPVLQYVANLFME